MRKVILSLSLFLFFLHSATAQTFSNNTSVPIPDVNATITVPITVTGLPTAINPGFGLISVCLNLNHPFIGELTIVLKAPTGTDSVRLLWHDGGNIAINSGICITESATQYIAAYHSGGNTNYFGEESNNIMNSGRNPNGVWTLRITDVVPGNAGSFTSGSITFGNNPPSTHNRVFGCSVSSPWGCRCPDGSTDCDLLPDMTNAEKPLQADLQETAGELRFSVATPNIGAGPLEMNGSTTECFCDATPVPCGTVCPAGQQLKNNVYQKIYHRSGNIMTNYTRLAGQMEYHPSHNHIHVDHWTNNTLRIKTMDPNPTHWPIIGTSYKISFCLVNLGSCDSYAGYCKDNAGNVLTTANIPNYNFGVVSGCGPGQGIYPGRVDEYSAGLDGQAINVTPNCNGTYYLVSITDPDNNVKEIDDNNNWAAVPVHLNRQAQNCCKTGFRADTLHGIDSLWVQFIDSSVAIPNQWHWDFGDGTTSTQQFPLHHYTVPGVYTVKLSTQSETGCKDSLTRTNYITITQTPVVIPVNPIEVLSITLSPNPFKDQLVLRIKSPIAMNTELMIFDVIGRQLHGQKMNIPAGNSTFTLSAKAMRLGEAPGLFFLKLLDESGHFFVVKIVRD